MMIRSNNDKPGFRIVMFAVIRWRRIFFYILLSKDCPHAIEATLKIIHMNPLEIYNTATKVRTTKPCACAMCFAVQLYVSDVLA